MRSFCAGGAALQAGNVAVPSLTRSRPVLTDPLFCLAASVGILFLGLSKGGFSSIGMIATPLMALAIPPVQAAAIVLPILIGQDLMSLWVYRRYRDWWILKVMLPGAVIGVGVAWLLASYVSDTQVRLMVGLITLAFVLNAWFGRAPPPDPGRPKVAPGVFWGALSGFTSTLSHVGAPPFQIYVLPQRLEKLTFVGTSTVFFAAVNIVKLVPFFALGQFSTENLMVSLVLMPLAFATNMLGVWLVRRTSTALFYRIAHVLIFLVGLELIRGALMK